MAGNMPPSIYITNKFKSVVTFLASIIFISLGKLQLLYAKKYPNIYFSFISLVLTRNSGVSFFVYILHTCVKF